MKKLLWCMFMILFGLSLSAYPINITIKNSLGGGSGLTISYTTEAGSPTKTPTSTGEVLMNRTTGNIYMAGDILGNYSWGYLGSYNLTKWTSVSPAGLFQWYKADSGPIPATNNTTLTSWLDSSTTNNALGAVEGTSGKYQTGIQNGLPAVYFDGGGDMYGTNLTDVAQPVTYFLVIKPTSWGTGGYQCIMAQYNSANQILKTTGAVTLTLYAGSLGIGPNVADNTTQLITSVFYGASSSVEVNNGGYLSINTGTTVCTNHPVLGAAGGGVSNPYVGYIMEYLAYQGALTDADKTKVKNYLNAKWAVY